MTTYDDAMAKAAEIGREHGENAAAWWEQDNVGGRTPTRRDSAYSVALFVLRGIEDGDPMVMDSLPTPDLSGQWADGYLPADLTRDCGLIWDESHPSDESYWQSDLCDAYETAFSAAVEEAVTAACRSALAE